MDERESTRPLPRPETGNAAGAGPRSWVRSIRAAAPHGRRGQRSLNVIALVVLCAVVTGGTGLTAVLTRSTRHSTIRNPAATCVAPQAAPAPSAPEAKASPLGAWGFNLLEPGTFGSVVAGAGSSLYALQACGAEETQLRVLHLSENGNVLAVSGDFDRAALLTSSVVLDGGSLYVGTARLDLSGPATEAPYELTLYRLSASNLHVLGTVPVGRGYGLSLFASDLGHPDAGVLGSTGEKLLTVKPGTVSVRTLATFGDSIVQHVATDADAPYAAVSMVVPAAPADAGATVELLDAVSGSVVSSAHTVAGTQVESLAFGYGGLFVALGDGMSTEVGRFVEPVRATPGPAGGLPTGMPATLETISLDDTGGTLWAADLTTLACLDSSTGRLLSSWQAAPSSLSVNSVVTAGSEIYGVTSSGIGALETPTACRLAAG